MAYINGEEIAFSPEFTGMQYNGAKGFSLIYLGRAQTITITNRMTITEVSEAQGTNTINE